MVRNLGPRHLGVLILAMLLVLNGVTAAFAGRSDEQPIRREEEGAVEGAALVDDDDDGLDDEDDVLAADVNTELKGERSLFVPTTNGRVDEGTVADVTGTDGVDTDGIDTVEAPTQDADADDTAETADD